jgi:Cu/Zn superoxide dismutase
MNIINKGILISGIFALTLLAGTACAASTQVDIHRVTKDGQSEKVGKVTIEETAYGLVFTPDLKGLASGGHGFHIHAKGDCGPGPDATTGETIAAGAAGGHYDPNKTDKHGMPWDENSHLGDLPLLYVDGKGVANTPVLAPRLKNLDQVKNRALMIHEGGDNYSDHPKPLGGGDGRISCGVIR